jgi:hypothetical protein
LTVTEEQIRGLVLDVPTDFDFAQVCVMAQVAKDEYLDATTLSAGKLEMIELLLACHFTVLAVEKGGLVKQTIGDASETYHDLYPRMTGLLSTRFGAQAVAMDPSGSLAALSTSNLRAEFKVYGV